MFIEGGKKHIAFWGSNIEGLILTGIQDHCLRPVKQEIEVNPGTGAIIYRSGFIKVSNAETIALLAKQIILGQDIGESYGLLGMLSENRELWCMSRGRLEGLVFPASKAFGVRTEHGNYGIYYGKDMEDAREINRLVYLATQIKN